MIAALGVTQLIGYGTLYYAFSILAPSMAAGVGWSSEWIFGAFSAALLCGGLSAPFVGRWIDRYGAGRIMSLGSLAAAAALALCAAAPTAPGLVAGLIMMQLAANMVQYSAAFSMLVQTQPVGASRSITYLTLIAGLASTIFWPITTALHAHWSWPAIYLIFAALHLLVCLPIHAWLGWTAAAAGARDKMNVAKKPAQVTQGIIALPKRAAAFRWMVVGFALSSFVNSALLVHMVPALGALGLGAAGALVGTLFGPAQVMSRFTNMLFGGGLPQLSLAIIAAVLQPLAIVVLLLTAPWLAGGVAFAIVFGLGSGLFSIVQGTLPLALFGSEGYAERLGRVTSVRLAVSSAAPFVFALSSDRIGVVPTLALTALLGAGAIMALIRIETSEGNWLSRLVPH